MRSSFGVITTSPGFRTAEQRRALRPVAERLGARDAALDEHLVDRQAVHLGVAGDDALLHVEALALVGLLHGGDARVAVAVAGRGRGGGSCRTHGTLVRGRRLQVTGEAIAGGSSGHVLAAP